MTLGVIIARFQVPELTIGHKYLISKVLSKFDTIGFLLGVSDTTDHYNPLPYQMREQLVRRFFGQHPPLFVKPLYDEPGNDVAWSRQVDFMLDRYRVQDYMDITLVGGRDSFIPHYRGFLSTLDIGDLPQAARSMSGTSTRQEIDIIDSADFRAGVIWQVRNGR